MTTPSKASIELDPKRDFTHNVPVRKRYLVLASPRTGSTWLCRSLHTTQIAGDPLEYFSRPMLKHARHRFGDQSMGYFEFLAHMEKLRTSINGVFGMHTHFDQLATAFKSPKPTTAWQQFFNRFQCFINIRRRDRLAQAVSYAIAFKSGAWTSEAVGLPMSENQFSDTLLLKSLNFVSMSDLAMQELIRDFALPCKTIWYEDLELNATDTLKETLIHIGATPNALASGAAPITKQSTELNEVLKSRLADYLGVATA